MSVVRTDYTHFVFHSGYKLQDTNTGLGKEWMLE